MTSVDRWALHKTADLIKQATDAYEACEFHRVYQLINNFCNEVLSATYHDILKDRLYTYASHWPERRSSQTAIFYIFNALSRLLAPILTFTSDEAHGYLLIDDENADDSIHLQDWPELDQAWVNEDLVNEIDQLLKFRDRVNEAIEVERQQKTIGQSLDAEVSITGDEKDNLFRLLLKHQNDLPEYFIVSQVRLNSTGASGIEVSVKHAEGERCPRSWRWVPELVPCEGFDNISPRCRDALEAKKTQTA